jgi:peptidoglycan/xylan/chitin deacetylase (PgdA/CDA1 family)
VQVRLSQLRRWPSYGPRPPAGARRATSGPPGLSGVGRAGRVALTFDDGPDPASKPAFLDALGSLGWKATFFMLGGMAAVWPELVAEVAQRGHEVAVHGYTHSNHLRHGPGWVSRELLATRDKLAELNGVAPLWVRPPYGALSASTFVGARPGRVEAGLVDHLGP